MRERRTSTPLVGRETELARALRHADEPATGALLFTGPIGIGKSRLVEGVMAELASHGWRSVGISATESGSQVSYVGLSELLPDTIDSIVELSRSDADLAIVRALEDVLDLNGPTPAVVGIDDISLIDRATCDVLVHLATNRRLFIVASDGPDPALSEALRRLTPAEVAEIVIEPLTVTGTAEVAALTLGGPVGAGLVRSLHTKTLGNPLFVQELLEVAIESAQVERQRDIFELVGELQLSPTMGRKILFRFGLLSESERDVLELLALAGELGADEIADVADATVVEAMEQRGMLVTEERGRRLRARIAHPLQRAAVVADLTPLRSRRRNRELAALLDSSGSRRTEDGVLHALARHNSRQVIPVDDLVEATYTALRLDRINDAAGLAEAAFKMRSDETTRAAFAEALIRLGRFREADTLLADPVAEGTSDWQRLRRAIRRSSNQLWGFGDAAAAWQLDDDCLAHVTDPHAVDRIVAHQAWVEYCDGHSQRAIERTDRLVTTSHAEVRFAMSVARAPALILCGRIDEGAELAQRAWDAGWGADTEFGSHGQHLIGLGWAKLYGGDLASAEFIAHQAIEHCRANHENTPLLFFLDLAAWSNLASGDLTSASGRFEEALVLGTDLAIGSSIRSTLAGLTICRAQMGRREDTERAWRHLQQVPVAPGPRGGVDVLTAEAWIHVIAGDPQRAVDLLRGAADEAGRRGLHTLELHARFDVARLGYATAADVEAMADRRCDGVLAETLQQAIVGCAAHDAAALDAVGERLADSGFYLWAAELLAQASDRWSSLKEQRASTASQRASEEARSHTSGAQTPALARAQAVDPLTRREREIANLASSGASNASIADQLHLSIRTVETHLGKIYRKLGVGGRSEL